MPDTGSFFYFFQQQPFLAYSLLASIILFVVSLFSGLFRLDFISAFGPRGLLSIVLSVLSALCLRLLCLNLLDSDQGIREAVALSLPRLPLYLMALAYGPSAGLVAGLLFLSMANLLSFPELILLIELTVLGWFAISPSPRQFWWASSLGILFSYALTWAAAGSAYLQLEFQDGPRLAAHLALHQDKLFSLAGVALVIALFRPKLYERIFPNSHIAPEPLPVQALAEPEIVFEPQPMVPERYISKAKNRRLSSLENLQVFELSKYKSKVDLTEPASPKPFERPRRSKKRLESIDLPQLSQSKN